MDKAKIKVLLASYRPDSDDAHDPVFREALDLMAKDPGLAAWFRAEKEFDAEMIKKFREVSGNSAARERLRDALRRAPDGDEEREKP